MTAIPFTPLLDRVLVRRERMKKVGSILVPDDAQRSHSHARGKVLAIGENCCAQIKATVGKEVIFGAHAGAWLDANGVVCGEDGADFFVLSEENIIGVIE